MLLALFRVLGFGFRGLLLFCLSVQHHLTYLPLMWQAGFPPLHYAAARGHLELAGLLLESKACVNQANKVRG